MLTIGNLFEHDCLKFDFGISGSSPFAGFGSSDMGLGFLGSGFRVGVFSVTAGYSGALNLVLGLGVGLEVQAV